MEYVQGKCPDPAVVDASAHVCHNMSFILAYVPTIRLYFMSSILTFI